MLKRILKFFLILVLSVFVLIWGLIFYAKHSAKQKIGEQELSELIKRIKSAPELPESFKNTYKKVYPGVFETSLNSSLIKTILRYRKIVYPPSKEAIYYYYPVYSGSKSRFKNKINYLGFMYLVEENISQEKCFEYTMNRFDFLNNQKGINNAARFYYKKSLDSLSLDEQLSLILSIENPSLYNPLRYPEKIKEKVERTKKELDL